MKNRKHYLELLDIIDSIHSINNKKDWPVILRKIARMFGAEEAFFASNENNILICTSSMRSTGEQYKHTKNETAAHTTIKNLQTLSIKDYDRFSSKSVYWAKRGVKSVLSVPVFFKDEVFGALQVVYFSKYTEFSKEDAALLEKIAKIISFVLYNNKHKERYNQAINMELKQIELIYKKQIPRTYKDEKFTQWMTDYLNRILRMTKAKAVGFVFPQEDIYVAVSTAGKKITFISYLKTQEVQNLITYGIWEKQVKDILLLEDLNSVNIEISSFAKMSNIKSALFVPIVINSEVIAVFAFGFDKINRVTKDYRIFLQTIAMHIMFAVETSKNLSRINSALSETEEKFTESFVLMMEARDTYTKGHSQRVAFYAKRIAEALGLNSDEQSMMYAAGLVHDIGKIGIPDAVLLKPGKLTKEECNIMKYHPEFSYQIIKDINRFKRIADSVRYHHERCDGSGYPEGLKSNDIPLGAKILAIADVFDAITTDRPYRKAMELEKAIDTMLSLKNEFDKEVLNGAIDILKESYLFEDMNEPYRNFMPEYIDNIRMEIFTKDFMTGLLRRKTFIEKVERAIKANKRFTVFYVDIKNLSRINYQYSMDVGDKVILATAEVLRKTKYKRFLARTQPDVFYFLYFGKSQPEIFAAELKEKLQNRVIEKLSKEEMDIYGWENIVDFYVAFSEFVPGKSAEDMMYECQKRKKEVEELINE